MRVGEAGPRPEPRATTAGRFTEALERAGSRDGPGRTERGREAVRRPREPVRRDRPGAPDVGAAPLAGAGPGADRASRVEVLPATPELAAVARAVPPAIAARPLADGAPLALSFGRSLDVELRTGPEGVELRLLPDARLARAAEAELPRVVAALRLRGVAIARADVRPRAGGRAR